MTEKSATKERYILPSGRPVTGTLVWYYHICKRQAWLMSRAIGPDENHYALELGRAIHNLHYSGEKLEFSLEGIKVDFMRKSKGTVCEVKTSSRFLKQTKMQLAYYLYRLREIGINAKGELLIPEERKKFVITLSEELKGKVEETLDGIRTLVESEKPPPVRKCKFCGRCAYRDFCFA